MPLRGSFWERGIHLLKRNKIARNRLREWLKHIVKDPKEELNQSDPHELATSRTGP